MRRAKIIVPAVSANLGPGVKSLGLALALHVTVTMRERSDTRLVIDSQGEGRSQLAPDATNPVMYAAIRVFQRLEDAPLGLRVEIRNNIPLNVGLGADDALAVAGLVGANVLMDSPLSRDELIEIGGDITGRPDGVVTAMLGGLTVTSQDRGKLLFRRMEVVPLKIVVVVPKIADYSPATNVSRALPLDDAVYNLGRLALVIDALREGDFDLLGQALDDHLLEPHFRQHIPGLDEAIAAARQAGAVAMTISGEGPALLIFALLNHRKIANSVEAAFREKDIESRSWVLAVDTQGVVISAAESLS